MNIIKRIVLLVSVFATFAVKAQTDVYPAYTPVSYNIAIDYAKEGVNFYVEDESVHHLCGHLAYYELNGLPPAEGHRWVDVTGGTQQADAENSPTALMCRLLKAFRHANLDEVSTLYRPADAAYLDTLFAIDSVRQRWLELAGQVTRYDLLLAFTQGNKFNSFVDLYQGDERMFTTMINCKSISGQWYLTMETENSPITGTLLFYFYNYGTEGLEVSKDMDNDGIFNFDDNCPCEYNPDQTDSDGDGVGDGKIVREEDRADDELAYVAAAGDAGHTDRGNDRNKNDHEVSADPLKRNTEYAEEECYLQNAGEAGSVHVHRSTEGENDIGYVL